MSAFSLDPRQRALADCPAGGTYAAIARKCTVSAAWVRTSHTRFRETGEVAARSHATERRPYHARHEAELRAAVADEPDRALEQLRRHLGGHVSIGTPGRALRALEISLEGSPPGRPSRTAPTSRRSGSHGRRGRTGSTRTGSSSSTRPG